MGKCIYVGEKTTHKSGPVVRELSSETWMTPAAAGRVLAAAHLMNTTLGVWMYESDIWDKRALRQRLMALVRYVTSPEFLPEYEEWGRKQVRGSTPKGRNARGAGSTKSTPRMPAPVETKADANRPKASAASRKGRRSQP